MCGRFSLRTPPEELARKFKAQKYQAVPPRYNISPAQEVLAVMSKGEDRELALLLWGLIPSWSREPRGFINARAETILDKPSFRQSFKRQRCLIPADGFFEWRKQGRVKQPFYFQLKDGRPFAFAGIWDEWQGEGVVLPSCAIITTKPNEVVHPVHDRMPVILQEEDYELWLDDDPGKQHRRMELLRPYPAEQMDSYPVSALVNDPSHEGAALLEQARDALGRDASA